MYKILVVDDEKKERDGIAFLICQFKFDLSVTKANNGEEAIKLIKNEDFDILLTDIKMPLMNGIELLNEVHKLEKDMILIIYSAYGEFEYAQSAIQFGVHKYLLKPIEIEEFKKVFEDIIALCKERDYKNRFEKQLSQQYSEVLSYKLEKYILTLLEQENPSMEILEKIEQLENRFIKRMFTPILLTSSSGIFLTYWEELNKELKATVAQDILVIQLDDNQTLIISFSKNKEKNLQIISKKFQYFLDMIQNNYQQRMLVVIGNPISKLADLKNECRKLMQQADYQFFIKDSVILYNNHQIIYEYKQDMMNLYLERMYNSMRVTNYIDVKEELRKIYDYIENNTGFSSIYVKYIFTEAIRTICSIVDYDIQLVNVVNRIYNANSLFQIKTIVNHFIENIINHDRQHHNENRIIKMAKQIVFDKYRDPNLSLSGIADILHVTSSYLSSLFKLETGENLVKFITSYRMERAKELLDNTNMKISEICVQVGYINHSYFTSIFRNYEGVSPAEYRERKDNR